MKELVTPMWFEVKPTITAEDFARLAAAPLDPLQAWLLEHAFCGGAQPDMLTLEPSAVGDDGSRDVVARCQWCGSATALVIDAGPRDVVVWWANLLAHVAVRYRSVLLLGHGFDCAEWRRCYQALDTAIRMCVLLDDVGDAGIIH